MKIEWIDPQTLYIIHNNYMYCVFEQDGKIIMESRKLPASD